MNAPLWLHNLAAYSLQITLLVGVGGLLPYGLGLRIPKVRLAYWHLLLAVCLLLPAVEPWKRADAPGAADISVTTVAVAASTTPGRPLPSLPGVVLFVLAAGILTRVVWLAAGFWRLGRYRLRACSLRPVPAVLAELQSRLGARPEVRLSMEIASPVTFGLRRPIILLPTRFVDLAPSVQQAIACHELLHVRRRDWLFTVLEEGIRTALWFHPAIWWLLGQIQLAREQVVDREVVHLTRSREQYLEALLAVAAAGKAAPDLAPAPLFLRKRHLARRVASILKEVSMSKRRLIASLCAAVGVVFLASQLAVRAFPLQAPADEMGVTVETGAASLLHRAAIEYPRGSRQTHRRAGGARTQPE
jgi:beta-lactamase regulating signal transducer with metallopeptidase domain